MTAGSDTLATIAREAFAHGWALSGGPMTDRVKRGCVVAVGLACEHPDVPDVIEATLQLGSLEGTWAKIYDRREKLYNTHLAAVTTAYRAMTTELDVSDAVTRLQRAELGEADDNDQARRAAITAAATVEATRLLHQLADDPSAPTYQATVSAIATALADAQAEGVAGATALVAAEVGTASAVDFGLVFTDAHAELAKLGDYWADATGWLGNVINGNATDLGQALARVAIAGGDFDELRTAAEDVIDGEDITAVDTLIDLAMGQSFSRGALALYTREGVSTVDFVTAGGGRVCPICADAESQDPWSLLEVPQPALHPGCRLRCTLMPSVGAITALSANVSRYLTAA